jgi:hypothetical protein
MSEVDLAITRVLRAAEESFDSGAIEPSLTELLVLLREDGRRAEFVDALLALLHPAVGELQLARPGIVDILEFCMRELRWEEIRDVMQALSTDAASDWRIRSAAERVLEAYEDEWPGGEIYRTYRGE